MLTAINLPQTPKIIKKEGNLAVFEIPGYYPGYGLTMGNALRRVLLTSLPGAAIVAVKIEDVNHEFSTINYVAEDVIQIILNLKQVRLKMHSEGPQKMSLKVKGVKKVTAGDIKTSSSIEITNPEMHIATLTNKKAKLDIDFEVDSGLGYVPAEQIKKEKLDVGLIILDAIFTPVRRVNFTVQQMRVGQRTDYDLLRLEIETDGAILPEQALKKSGEILLDQFKVFADFKEKKESNKKESQVKAKTKTSKKSVKIPKSQKQPQVSLKLEDLKLPAKIISVLHEAGIKTVAGLSQRKTETIEALPGIGARSLREIKRSLGRLGLTLK